MLMEQNNRQGGEMDTRMDRIEDINKKVSEWEESCKRDSDPKMELLDLARRLEVAAEEIRDRVRGHSLLYR